MFKGQSLKSALLAVLLVGSAFLVLVGSCKSDNETEKNENPVARVYNNMLYPSDLKNIVPADITKKDSTAIIKKFIDKWIQDELVKVYAEKNLTSEQLNLNAELEEYKKNLIIYTYQSQLVKQKLDTNVSSRDIETFYTAHINDFMLKDNIVKVNYIKLNKKTPGIEKVKKWYISDQPKDRENLSNFCFQFAENFFIDENKWLLFDDILKEVPIESYNPELLLKTNKLIEVSDSTSFYFLRIKAFKIKNTISPLAFEKENIRNILINNRKIRLIGDMQRQVYEDGLKNKNFEIY